MEFRFVPFLITVVVGVVLVSTMLFPIISDVSATEKTLTNDGLWRMKEIENGDTWEKTSGGTWSYNDDDVLNYGTNGVWNACLGDNWLVRCNGNARGTFVSGTSTGAEVIAATDVITISGSGINSTATPSITGYGYSATGEYVLTSPTVAPYVKSDTPLYATGLTEIEGSSGDVVIHFTGNIEDGLAVTGYARLGGVQFDSVTISDVVIDKTEVAGYVDLYVINAITFTITAPYTDNGETTTYTQDATYTSYVVPYEVTAELSQHLNDTELTLVGIIPLLVVIGLILGVLAIFARRSEIF